MPNNLIKKLVADLSCNPSPSTPAGPYVAICQHAEQWQQQATQAPLLSTAIQAAATQLLHGLTHDHTSPLLFDLAMVHAVGTKLETAPATTRQQFASIVAQTMQPYQLTLATLEQLKLPDQLSHIAYEISKHIGQVTHTLQLWGSHTTTISDTAVRLPLPGEVKDFVTTLQTKAKTISQFSEQIDTVMTALWDKVEHAVSSTDILHSKLVELKALALPTLDLTQSAKIQAQIAAIESLLVAQAPPLEKTLTGIKSGFHAVGMLAALYGETKFAGDIIAIGETTISVANSVATLATSANAGGLLMPALAIIGTIGSLASQLLNGSSFCAENVLLNQLNRIAKHFDARFNRIEAMIQQGVSYLAEHIDQRILALGRHVDTRFTRLEQTLFYMHKNILEKFARLHEIQADLAIKLRELKTALFYSNAEIMTAITELYEADYRDIQDAALSPIAREEIENNTHRAQYRRIVKWASQDTKKTSVTGIELTNSAALIERVTANGIARQINSVRNYALSLTTDTAERLTNTGDLVNPILWADAARTLIAYFSLSPVLYQLIQGSDANQPILQDLAKIIAEGNSIHLFLAGMQKNSTLFARLTQTYADCLQEIIHHIYRLTVSTEGAPAVGEKSANPKDALARVAAIHTMSTFIQREIYPAGTTKKPTNLPTVSRVSGISITSSPNFSRHRETILYRIAQAIQGGGLQGLDGSVFEALMAGRVLSNYGGSFINNLHVIEGEIAAMESGYNNTRSEASALRTLATTLENFLLACNDDKLINQPDYRRSRIQAILADAATDEVIAAQAARRLPHRELLTAYFTMAQRTTKNDLILRNLTPENELTQKLTRLQVALDELIIFIAFAFPRQFMTDAVLRGFLDTLWGEQEIRQYLATDAPTQKDGASTQEFIGTALQKIVEPGGEFDRFQAYLLGKVTAAKLHHEQQLTSEEFTHPLVQTVLKELAALKAAATLALSQPKIQAQTCPIYHKLGTFDPTTEPTLWNALAQQLRTHAFNPTEFASDVTAEIILQQLAVQHNIEVMIIDDTDDSVLSRIRSINPGGHPTIHLRKQSESAWYSFTPSEECCKTAEYQAARLLRLGTVAAEDVAQLANLAAKIEAVISTLDTSQPTPRQQNHSPGLFRLHLNSADHTPENAAAATAKLENA